MEKKYLINFDGGAAPTNPGHAAYGFIIYEIIENELEPIYAGGNYIGIQTNNYAEYSGILNAIQYFKDNLYNTNQTYKINIKGDSKLVIEQLNSRWKCESSNIIELYKKCKQIINQLKFEENIVFQLEHIYRNQNEKSDSICNYCIQNKKDYEEYFL